MMLRPPHRLLIEAVVRHALEEDLGRPGAITRDLVAPADTRIAANLVAPTPGTVAGLIAAECAFGLVDPSLRIEIKTQDGSRIERGTLLATVEGPARGI